MQYKVDLQEKGKIEIRVDVPAASFDAAYNDALSEFSLDAKIAGFRPGKAPDAVVEQHVGLAKILNRAASSSISKYLDEIFKKEDLVPLDSPKIGIDSLSRGAAFSFSVTFTKKPEVKVGDWKKIKVAKIKQKEITDEDVNKSIKNIFEAWEKQKTATTEDTEGDTEDTENQPSFAPSTSLRASADDKSLADKSEGKGKFIYDAHGNKVFFDKKTLRSSSNQDSTAGLKTFLKDESAQSTPEESKLTSEEKNAPDDNFAREVGARDLAHLRELVRHDLETLIANQVETKFEEDIFEKIIEVGTAEVPDILVEEELNRILVRLSSELERQSRKMDEYLRAEKTTVAELKEKWRPQAEKNVKVSLLMDEIGRQEQVQVTREEVDRALSSIKDTNLTSDQKSDLERYIIFNIFQAKTLDLVKKTVFGDLAKDK